MPEDTSANLPDSLFDEDIPIIDEKGNAKVLTASGLIDRPQAAGTIVLTPPPANLPTAPVAPAAAAPEPAAPEAPAPAAAPPPPEPPKETFVTVQPADTAEIAAAAETVEKKVDTQKVKTVDEMLDGMVDEAVAISGVKLADEDMARRYKTMVKLYFRDLRDELETKSKLTMVVASGGMGLDDNEAERVLSMLRPKLEDFHALMSGKIAAGKERYVSELAEKQLTETERTEQAEADKRDSMFGELIERAGGKAQPQAAPGVAVPPAPIEPIRPAEPKFIPVMAAPKPAPVPPVELPKPFTPPVPPLAPAKPPVASAAPKPAPVPPAFPKETKTVVADVKVVPKLTGPIDELRSITVKDFRRLSKDPHEATLKIKDKIDLLEDQSFEARAGGIKAWQESEANRVYLDLLRKSLEGKPILDIIADRESKGETTLNKAEFDAIMELNRKLRFG